MLHTLFALVIAANPAPNPESEVALKIGPRVIAKKALEHELAAALQVQSYHGGVTPDKMAKAKSEVIARVVQENLLALEIERLGLKPDPVRLERLTDEEAIKYGGRASFEAMLKKKGQTIGAFQATLAKRALVEQAIDASFVVSAEEKSRDAKEWYATHREVYVKPGSYRLKYVNFVIDPGNYTATLKAAAARADGFVAKVRNGSDFMALAKEFPQDKVVDLGWVHEGSLLPDIEKAVQVTKLNELTAPVQNTYGVHVVQVVDVKPAEPLTYERVEQAILAERAKARRERMLGKLLEDCRRRWPVQVFVN